MPAPLFISPHLDFWQIVARRVREATGAMQDCQVLVPAFSHAQCLKQALAQQAQGAMLAPRIHTLDAWIALQMQLAVPANSQRLLELYAQLRQHGWLKNLFAAREQLDLLPLANTLLDLCDELSGALLPGMLVAVEKGAESSVDRGVGNRANRTAGAAEYTAKYTTGADDAVIARHWEQALQQLAPPARQLLSEESQLVWTIWKAQVEQDDPALLRTQALLKLAQQAQRPLLWINPVAPDPLQEVFLQEYARHQPLTVVTLDWRPDALHPVYRRAWPEMLAAAHPHDHALHDHKHEHDAFDSRRPEDSHNHAGMPDDRSPGLRPGLSPADQIDAIKAPTGVQLCPASSLEQEAQQGAQILQGWLAQGKSRIAIIAQDRVVARRIRALLERSQVWVADETGWKLSTTRAAAVLAAWFEVISSSGEVIALLDLLKSPFVFAQIDERDEWLMALEAGLRRQNVLSGWSALLAAMPGRLDSGPLRKLAQQAALYTGRKTVAEWASVLDRSLEVLGIKFALAEDLAGQQVLALLANMAASCQAVASHFQFAEWRAAISLQIEATPFVPDNIDQRVMMLPLNGARIRPFECVLMVGVDAAALPSQPPEVLFFANAVRRELGLATREQRQQQQLRDFTEILTSGAEVVLSWQQFKNGEPNAISPWLERLQLVLALHRQDPLPQLQPALPLQALRPAPATFARPVASSLLPGKLSSSAYQRFLACPYAFFASYMLGLSAWDEFSDLPEKRDYGDWLHGILYEFHEQLQQADALAKSGNAVDALQAADSESATAAKIDPASLLAAISQRKFEQELRKSAAALGYYVRWQKVMPAYLAWVEAHAQAGWQYAAGEQKLETPLHWPGGQIMLRGRIDRIDHNEDGRTLVLDYKTSSQTVLKQKMQGEDQQLAFYGLLAAQAGEAMLLGLEAANQKIGEVPAPDYANWVARLENHIARSMQALQQGSGLPANGVDSACQYCEMRGLCRKGAWQ